MADTKSLVDAIQKHAQDLAKSVNPEADAWASTLMAKKQAERATRKLNSAEVSDIYTKEVVARLSALNRSDLSDWIEYSVKNPSTNPYELGGPEAKIYYYWGHADDRLKAEMIDAVDVMISQGVGDHNASSALLDFFNRTYSWKPAK